MTSINFNDPAVLQLYRIRHVDSYEEFLQLFEAVLDEASERICSNVNKNSEVKNFKELYASAQNIILDIGEFKKHVGLLQRKLEDDISCRIVDFLDSKRIYFNP